jgi:hypothetical protein
MPVLVWLLPREPSAAGKAAPQTGDSVYYHRQQKIAVNRYSPAKIRPAAAVEAIPFHP